MYYDFLNLIEKGYGEICETTEECDDGGLVCDVIECLCPEGMYYDGICKQSKHIDFTMTLKELH
jgi:hypothetical protein